MSCTAVLHLSTACLMLSISVSEAFHVVVWSVESFVANIVLFFHLSFSSHVHTSAVEIVLCSPKYFALQVLFWDLHSTTSLLVTPLISLRTVISAACTLLVVADVSVHVSQSNTRSERRTLLYIITLPHVSTYLSLRRGCSRPTFLLYWEIRSFITVSFLGQLLKVSPRYLKIRPASTRIYLLKCVTPLASLKQPWLLTWRCLASNHYL